MSKKRIVKILFVGILCLGCFTIGKINTTTATKIKIESYNYIEKGKCIVELSDNSFALVDENKNIYSFYHYDMGDYDISFNTLSDLKSYISNYIDINSNL